MQDQILASIASVEAELATLKEHVINGFSSQFVASNDVPPTPLASDATNTNSPTSSVPVVEDTSAVEPSATSTEVSPDPNDIGPAQVTGVPTPEPDAPAQVV